MTKRGGRARAGKRRYRGLVLPYKHAKRRRLSWSRRGKIVRSRVPLGSQLQRIRYTEAQSMTHDKVVYVSVEAFGTTAVLIDTRGNRAFATDGSFALWGHVDEKGKFWSNSDDITTNYLEVASVRALKAVGIKVKDVQPSPYRRRIEVVKVRDYTEAEHRHLEAVYKNVHWSSYWKEQ